MGSTSGGGQQRSRERNAELTREMVLRGAMDEFTAKGFAGARIDAVAERAGVNVRAIYQHFDSKAALFDAVLGDSVRRRHEQLIGEIGPLLTAEGGFAELFPLFRRVLSDQPGWARLMAWKELSEELDADVDEIWSAPDRRALYRREIELFDAARRQGRVPDGLDSDLLLLALTALAAFPWFVRPLTMLVTGTAPESTDFYRRWDDFLGAFGRALVTDGARPATPGAARGDDELRTLGRAVDRAGLAGPFGRCSVRVDADRFVVTPPRPLRLLATGSGVEVPVSGPVPDNVVPQVGVDQRIFRARPDVAVVVTMEPASVRALVAAGRGLAAGRGGTAVPVVRADDDLVAALGDGPLAIRADGVAVVVAQDAPHALALAVELESAASAALHGADVVVRTDHDDGRVEQAWEYFTGDDPGAPDPLR